VTICNRFSFSWGSFRLGEIPDQFFRFVPGGQEQAVIELFIYLLLDLMFFFLAWIEDLKHNQGPVRLPLLVWPQPCHFADLSLLDFSSTAETLPGANKGVLA
jgi:hypothetical protein